MVQLLNFYFIHIVQFFFLHRPLAHCYRWTNNTMIGAANSITLSGAITQCTDTVEVSSLVCQYSYACLLLQALSHTFGRCSVRWICCHRRRANNSQFLSFRQQTFLHLLQTNIRQWRKEIEREPTTLQCFDATLLFVMQTYVMMFGLISLQGFVHAMCVETDIIPRFYIFSMSHICLLRSLARLHLIWSFHFVFPLFSFVLYLFWVFLVCGISTNSICLNRVGWQLFEVKTHENSISIRTKWYEFFFMNNA